MWQIVDNFGSALLVALQVLFFAKCSINSNKNISIKKLFFLIFGLSFFFLLIFWYFDGMLKTLMVALVCIFMYINLYNISFTKSIFLTFTYIIVLMISDLFVLFCLTNVFRMDKQFCYNVFAGSFLGDLVVFIIFILVVYLLKKYLKKLLDTQIDTDKKIILFSILTFFCVSLFFYTIIEKFLFTEDVMLYIMCIILLLLVLSSAIKQVIDNKKLSAKYDKLLEFMTTYENEIEQQRILRHEIKNEFLVVRAKLLDSQKKDEIVYYIDEILKDKITIKQEKYAKFGYLPPGIKGLCYFKVQEAENLGVKVSINISKKVKDFNIDALTLSHQRDLARILGVFLDNAREASIISKDKKMGLEIYFDKEKEIRFIISNTFANEIDINKIGKVVFSTKGSGRGHGLMLVNYILENNKIFHLKTDVKNNVYVQNLYVQIKNNK